MIDGKTRDIIKDYLYKIDCYFSSDCNVILTHYVRGNGVPELIGKYKQLRLTKIDEMKNDALEGHHIIQIFKKCIFELHNDGSISEEDYNILKDCSTNLNYQLHSTFTNRQFESKRIETTPYVVCFSNEDTPYMWSEYSDGVAIKLYINETTIQNMGASSGLHHTTHLKLYKVIYESNEFKNWMKCMIIDAKNSNDIELFEYLVHILLVHAHVAVKSSEFKEEKEYRLVFFKPDNMAIDDPVCSFICKEHADCIGTEQILNKYDPNVDKYVWVDISSMLIDVVRKDQK